MNKMSIDPRILECLGYPEDQDCGELLDCWKKVTSAICKPCWELKYCPYGPLVEDFPLLPESRDKAIARNEFSKQLLKADENSEEEGLDPEVRTRLEESVRLFDVSEYPKVPTVLAEQACSNFGHLCPVYFVHEGFTETKEGRKSGRTPTQGMKLKVALRDNCVCQECRSTLLPDEIEYDHIIPYSKGGPTSVENLRVLCRTCNRARGNRVDDLLDPWSGMKHLQRLRGSQKPADQDNA
jgi:hypothetical protein